MKVISILTLAVVLFASCGETGTTKSQTTNAPTMEESPKLRHVVMFKFKESATEADIKQVEEAFLGLKSKIKEIKDIEWGTNNSPEGLDKGFTHCFILTFDSEEGRAIYLPHPDHDAFGAVLRPHLEDVMVLDYWAK